MTQCHTGRPRSPTRTHCYAMSARRKGANLEPWMIDRIVFELGRLGMTNVNLGGNEPIFTNGIRVRDTLLHRSPRNNDPVGLVAGRRRDRVADGDSARLAAAPMSSVLDPAPGGCHHDRRKLRTQQQAVRLVEQQEPDAVTNARRAEATCAGSLHRDPGSLHARRQALQPREHLA